MCVRLHGGQGAIAERVLGCAQVLGAAEQRTRSCLAGLASPEVSIKGTQTPANLEAVLGRSSGEAPTCSMG